MGNRTIGDCQSAIETLEFENRSLKTDMHRKEFFTKIVGVTFENGDGISRQQILEEIADDIVHNGLMKLHVLRDNENPHDANAIAVFDKEYRQIGFLSRDIASQLAPMIDKQQIERMECEVTEVTGLGVDENYGLNIRFTYWEKS